MFVSEVTFDGAASAVPEPGTWALIATGLGAIVFMRRRIKL